MWILERIVKMNSWLEVMGTNILIWDPQFSLAGGVFQTVELGFQAEQIWRSFCWGELGCLLKFLLRSNFYPNGCLWYRQEFVDWNMLDLLQNVLTVRLIEDQALLHSRVGENCFHNLELSLQTKAGIWNTFKTCTGRHFYNDLVGPWIDIQLYLCSLFLSFKAACSQLHKGVFIVQYVACCTQDTILDPFWRTRPELDFFYESCTMYGSWQCFEV